MADEAEELAEPDVQQHPSRSIPVIPELFRLAVDLVTTPIKLASDRSDCHDRIPSE